MTVRMIFENYPKQNSHLRNSRIELLSIEVHVMHSTHYIEVDLLLPDHYKLFRYK